MFSTFERMVAWRYLRSKKSDGFLSAIVMISLIGIMLSVATLIIVMSVMNGFRQDLFSRILGLNGHMNVYALEGPGLDDYDYLRSIILPVDGVRDAAPIIEGQSLVTYQGRASGVMVRGISWHDFFNRPILKNSVLDGALDDFKGNQIGIGTKLAQKLRLRAGDTITLMAPQVKSTPFGSIPRQRSYKVAFVFDVGMYQYDAGYIFMPLETAQTFYKLPGSVNAIEIFLDDVNDLDAMRRTLELVIKGQARVNDWRDTNAVFDGALKTEKNVMFLILSMLVLIAAFNILSSMIMLVKDKTHDIAIMRTIGASSGNMMRVFMLTGASIGIVGTFLGSVLGISFALNIESIRQFLEGLTGSELFPSEIYFLSQLPAEIDWMEVVSVIVVALGLSILATVIPARRAARLDPVEALRYE